MRQGSLIHTTKDTCFPNFPLERALCLLHSSTKMCLSISERAFSNYNESLQYKYLIKMYTNCSNRLQKQNRELGTYNQCLLCIFFFTLPVTLFLSPPASSQ